jgi:hypothetical protein
VVTLGSALNGANPTWVALCKTEKFRFDCTAGHGSRNVTCVIVSLTVSSVRDTRQRIQGPHRSDGTVLDNIVSITLT